MALGTLKVNLSQQQIFKCNICKYITLKTHRLIKVCDFLLFHVVYILSDGVLADEHWCTMLKKRLTIIFHDL